MSAMARRVCAALVLWLGPAGAAAEAPGPGELDGPAILRAMAERDDGDRQVSVLEVTVTHPNGRQLRRVVRRTSLDFAHGTRNLLRFEEPARLRGTVVLSVDHREDAEQRGQWLYLPNLQTVSHLSGAHAAVPFLGTDLTHADLTSRDWSAYDSAVVEAESVEGEACWVLDLRPRTQAEVQATGYVKSRLWVSKQKLLTVKAKHWVEDGRKLKYLKFSQFEEVDSIWVARRLTVRVVKTGKVESTTVLTTRDVRFGQPDVTAEQFAIERLGPDGRTTK